MQYSVINYSEIELGNRIDAEYYRPIFVETEKKLKKGKWSYLVNLTESIKSFGAYSLCNQVKYKEDGIPFLRCKDVKNGWIDFSDVLYIDPDANRLLWKSEVKPETVLLTMSGTVGNSAIATEKIKYPINSNQDIAKITTSQKLNPYYFSIFLQSVHGKEQTARLPIGSVQQHIFLWQLEKIVVPLFDDEFQSGIENIFKKTLSLQDESVSIYNQAQTILLSELGLTDWQPKHQLTFIKNYSDTEQAERIDADYFQPKYEEIEDAIKSYPAGYTFIREEFKQNKSTFRIDDKKLYQYVEIGSVNVSNGEITPSEMVGAALPANAKRVLKKDDVIVSKVRTYRGAITIVEKNGYVGSGAFTVLRENGRINKETLLAFLHSKPLLAWSLKPNTGTSYPVIIDDDILSLSIPLLCEETQTQIQQKVIESFDLRKQSKHLLECAKRAVEMAVEQDEKTASNWLRNKTKEMQI